MIGRQALARQSGLGEGAARTVLKKLREGGYASVIASGNQLTSRGRESYALLLEKLSPFIFLEGSRLTMGRRQTALKVRGGASRLGSGLEQRDSATRVGAAGATTYAIRGGKFTVPGESSDCEKDFPSEAWRQLRARLAPREGDAVILCGSEDEITTKLGALAAALTLL